jgi:hypothetical protein
MHTIPESTMADNHKLETYLGSENYVEKMSKWDSESKNKK